MLFIDLAAQCAPQIPAELMAAIVSVESGFEPLAVRASAKLTKAKSTGDGLATVVGHRDDGTPITWGLAGLTEERLRRNGFSIADGFDPCRSLQAAAAILAPALNAATGSGLPPKKAERRALATYFVRETWRGWTADAYADRVLDERTRLVPALTSLKITFGAVRMDAPAKVSSGSPAATQSATSGRPSASTTGWQPQVRPGWAVFGIAPASSVLVFNSKPGH
jgi:type IV secretion system protein VirB1